MSKRRMVVIDFAQIEPRVVAHYSQDPALLECFLSGQDFYSVLAHRVFSTRESPEEIHARKLPIRAVSKTMGLSILYGIGPNKLSKTLAEGFGRPVSYREALRVRDDFFARFSALKAFQQNVAKAVLDRGFLKTFCGRLVVVPKDQAYHIGVNRLIQPSASDICCASQISLTRSVKESNIDAMLLHLVHDEVVWSMEERHIPEFMDLATEHMTRRFTLRVPLIIEAKVGDSWACK